jgi:hypothetical protein
VFASFWIEVWEAASKEPYSFVLGAIIGVILRSKFKVVRDKVKDEKEPDK